MSHVMLPLVARIGLCSIIDVNLNVNIVSRVVIKNCDVIPFIHFNLYIHSFSCIPNPIHIVTAYLRGCIIIVPNEIGIVGCIDVNLCLQIAIRGEAHVECIECSVRLCTNSAEQLTIQ